MTDRPRGSGGPEEGSAEYDWLYGSGQGAPTGPEATRVLPTTPRTSRPVAATGAQPTPPSQQAARPAQPVRGDGRPPAAPPRSPSSTPTVPSPGSPPRKRRRWLVWVGVAVAAWLVYLVAVPFWAWTQVSQVDAFPASGRPPEQAGTTYLLVGSDSRQGLSKQQRKQLGTGSAVGQRTDTIMLLHTGAGPNLLMSIPRDSLVPIPGHGRTKINAAFAYGGPKLLTRTIEQNTGIRIDHYVEIGFGGFVDVVDAVGGIEICPTFDMKDPLANLDIKKGCQQADGVTALGFARSRHTDPQYGDITRGRHQREVVSAVGHEALSPWTFLNPVRYYRLNVAAARSLTVDDDTGPFDMARFAMAMTRVSGSSGLTCTVPIKNLSVEWDPSRSAEMFTHIAADETDKIGKRLCTKTGLPR